MKIVKRFAIEHALVQGGGQQHAGHARVRQRGEIGRVAYAAGRMQPAAGSETPRLGQPRPVRSPAHADARQTHHDNVVRPVAGGFGQPGGTDESRVAEVQRQNRPGRIIATHGPAGKAFAAQDRAPHAPGLPRRRRRRIGKPCVDPQLQRGMRTAQTCQHVTVIATALNRIQIGNVQSLERVKFQQASDHGFGHAALAQRGVQRPVIGTAPRARAHDLSVHQVEHRDQV
ncbi:MAG: hypothetical protein ABT21_13500 [Thiobacillus sp. SCN 65-179]|nr:MAG: hypothetical protein ABT21_13500 [Thiobacillus sp. SCN 65-179]